MAEKIRHLRCVSRKVFGCLLVAIHVLNRLWLDVMVDKDEQEAHLDQLDNCQSNARSSSHVTSDDRNHSGEGIDGIERFPSDDEGVTAEVTFLLWLTWRFFY